MSTMSSDSRGRIWLSALAGPGSAVDGTSTVLAADAPLGGETARFIAVVPDPANRFPRARHGEVGLDEGWGLAAAVRAAIEADRDGAKRPIVAVVDVTSQAYGRQEEMLGIHLACAAAADAYATARLAGHPVVALLVGKAMSGAFLAHGYQANRILALADDGVLVHAMGREAAARVTRRTVAELDRLGEQIPPMAYGIRAYAGLGLLHRLIEGVSAEAPDAADVERVRAELAAAVADIRTSGRRNLSSRLASPEARQGRAASIEVRRRLAEQWDAE
ncbi:biotin-independent malonate decarboxylase subunit gamma [Inquilinus sp. NPDC058860]|uniref:biotin-independent malonate decarboxylase subunit gamma n=1 Tax=Inquilinus sp. NPDC058860 TaxID=3346652 RepID=UPI0036CCFC89